MFVFVTTQKTQKNSILTPDWRLGQSRAPTDLVWLVTVHRCIATLGDAGHKNTSPPRVVSHLTNSSAHARDLYGRFGRGQGFCSFMFAFKLKLVAEGPNRQPCYQPEAAAPRVGAWEGKD